MATPGSVATGETDTNAASFARPDFQGLGDAAIEQLLAQHAATPPPPAPAPAATTAPAPPPPAEEIPGKIRVRTNNDPVVAQAFDIFNQRAAAGNPVTLGEAETLAKQVLGIPTPAPTPDVPPPAPTPAASPDDTLKSKQRELITQLAAAQDTLSADYNPQRAIELQEQLTDLATERGRMLARQDLQAELAQQQQQQTAATFGQAWDASFNQASTELPALKDETSPLAILAGGLIETAKANPAHPLHAVALSADAPLHFAREAAKALGMAPAARVPATTPAPPSVPPVSTPQSAPLASVLGGGSSPPALANPSQQLVEQTAGWSGDIWTNVSHAFAMSGTRI